MLDINKFTVIGMSKELHEVRMIDLCTEGLSLRGLFPYPSSPS